MTEAKSGTEATGTTQTNLLFLPYRQTYTYDAFSHKTSRLSTLWTVEDWDFYDSFTNNRGSGWTCDDAGRATSADGVDFEYDAAGNMIKNSRSAHFELTVATGGDETEWKRAVRKWNSGTSSWDDWEANYFINSSVLGKTISEVGDTGKKKRTFVIANGSTLARQVVDDEDAESVSWEYSDASGQTIRMTGPDGTGAGTDLGSGELDPLGNNVGTHGGLSDPRNADGEISPANLSPISNEAFCNDAGIIGPCSVVELISHNTVASEGSDYPFAFSPTNSRTGRDRTNPLAEQMALNSLENWKESGHWADTPVGDRGGEETCQNGRCSTDPVLVNASPSILTWVPNVNNAVNRDPQDDKGKVKSNLDKFLKNKSTSCADAIKALGLTDTKLLETFDGNTFYDGGSSATHADTKTGVLTNTSWKTSNGKRVKGTTVTKVTYGPTSTTTKNGVIDFLGDFNMGWLIHELSHAALRKGDLGIYDSLIIKQAKGEIKGLPNLPTNEKGKPIRNKDTASSALDEFFNTKCAPVTN